MSHARPLPKEHQPDEIKDEGGTYGYRFEYHVPPTPAFFSYTVMEAFWMYCLNLWASRVKTKSKRRYDFTHRMPARIPLKPAPITAIFIGLYSSILQSPSENDDGPVTAKISGSALGSVTLRTCCVPADMVSEGSG